jgi:hypothetical protein
MRIASWPIQFAVDGNRKRRYSVWCWRLGELHFIANFYHLQRLQRGGKQGWRSRYFHKRKLAS